MTTLQKIKAIIEENENEALLIYKKECEYHSEMAKKGDVKSITWIKKLINIAYNDDVIRKNIPVCVMQVVFDSYVNKVDIESNTEAKKIERRCINRNEFISTLQASQYISDATGYSLKCSAGLINVSNVFDVLPLFKLDMLAGVANDVSPKHEEDYQDMNKAIGCFSSISDGHHEIQTSYGSDSSVLNRTLAYCGQYGWEKQEFLKHIFSFFEPIYKALNHTIEPTKQDYLDPKHPRYAPKLAASIKVWKAMEDESLLKGKGTVSAMKSWLELRYKELGLIHKGKINNTAIQEVAKVANWNEDGGAPTTL